MAINKKGVFETLQHKISNIDSNSSTSVIIDTLKAVKKADHNTIISYTDSSDLPTASATNYRLAYVTNVGQLRFNNGLQWDKLQTQLPSKAPVQFSLGGTTFGYIGGGQYSPGGNNIIQKFSFTSDGNASDVADLTVARGRMSGTSSNEHGYVAGGEEPAKSNVVDRFTFASEGNAVDVGDLLYTVASTASHSDGTFGYISGGDGAPLDGTQTGLVQRFPFASSITTTDVGDFASVYIERHAGVSSTTHGYTMGGLPSPVVGDQIHKFDFSSSITSSDIGNLTQARQELCGQSSSTHGYATGGYHVDPTSPSDQVNNIWNTIDKIAFASDGNATDVGDLADDGGYYRVRSSAANESTTNGYASGGVPTAIEEMYKFPFASDTNATDIGNLVSPQRSLDGAGNMNGR